MRTTRAAPWRAAVITAAVLPVALRAGPLDFDNYPIDFSAPKVLTRPFEVTPGVFIPRLTVTANEPTLVKHADGFSVVEFSYTITDVVAADDGPLSPLAVVAWDASRRFDHGAPADTLFVHIAGETTATFSAGTAAPDGRFFVNGFIDLGSSSVQHLEDFSPADPALSWDKWSDGETISAGEHHLRMRSGVTWFSTRAGESLTISSRYAIATVPQPNTVALLAIALAGLQLLMLGRRRRAACAAASGVTAAAMPEPGTLVLLAVAPLLAGRRWKKS